MHQDRDQHFCCSEDRTDAVNKIILLLGLYSNDIRREDEKGVIDKKIDRGILPLANPYIAFYLILVVSMAVVFNILVLTVLTLRRKRLQSFQLCLLSVCASDLLFSLLLHPMSILTALGYDSQQIFSRSGCIYFGVLALFFGSFDMVIHSGIALLRYLHVCHPGKMNWLSHRSILAIISVCAIYSMIWCIGPLFGIGKYETFEVGCTMAFSDDTWSGRIFVNCAFIFVFFTPLAIIIYSYVAIIMKASKQRKILERMGTVSNHGLTVELKLVRLTCVIAAAYVIVWLPYAVVCLAETYGHKDMIPWVFRILAALFCKTGTATNPIIYLFMSKGFRRETAETIRYLTRTNCAISRNPLLSSSQKSSSYRSNQSQISLRSSRCSQARRERSSMQRKLQCTRTDSNPVGSCLNTVETTV